MYVLSESMLGGLFIPKNRTSNQNLKSKLLDRRITFIKLKKRIHPLKTLKKLSPDKCKPANTCCRP